MTIPVTATTPTKEIEGIDHRRCLLSQALAHAPEDTEHARLNLAALQHLADQRAAWESERRRNWEAWIEFHTTQRRAHQKLARRHHLALTALLRMEASLDEPPSTNGTPH